MPDKILITGGAGFIGSHLGSRLLADGHDVVVLDDFNDYYDPRIKRANVTDLLKGASIVEGDIRDRATVENLFAGNDFTQVVHLAARAGVRPSIKDPELYIETNIRGTYHLLEAAKRHGKPKFVFASSSSVYGMCPHTPFSESLPLPQTISPYAMTKLSGEHLCANYSYLYGIQTICLRFFTVYGPGQRPDLAIHKFTRSIWSGEPVTQYGDGSSSRDYTYIHDIIDGITKAMRHKAAFDVFNLGESQTTSLKDLIGLIEDALGKKAEITYMPDQPGDVKTTYADITKARDVLGYNPTTKVKDGIPKFVEWFRRLNG